MSLEDRKGLMSGSRTGGPTLAITAGAPAASVPTAFTANNNNGIMHTANDYVSKLFMIFKYQIFSFFRIHHR